ncbi:hypothetical protein L9F63_023990 [Diploptera punctata]|uniref:Bis(5'-nucleosyl)-tetraphosphatase [asymmetrical] n=1 Tax=Diploptera punctata TaxID=6984 RepID=A0AAD7ZIQ2_DIPPU|nr:hypothetical protein L9F63_023990 [Diploptera punctata]
MATANELRASGFVIFRMVCNKIEYLLLQTSYGKHHWTPPKGHVDPGETDLETAFRETEEEAGLTRNDIHVYEDFTKVIKYPVRGVPKTTVYLLGEVKQDTPVKISEEHQDFKWLQLNKACELLGHQTLQQVLQDCELYLKNKKFK